MEEKAFVSKDYVELSARKVDDDGEDSDEAEVKEGVEKD